MYNWSVVYQYHDVRGGSGGGYIPTKADSIVEAVRNVDGMLSDWMENYGWDDYQITNVNVIHEMH